MHFLVSFIVESYVENIKLFVMWSIQPKIKMFPLMNKNVFFEHCRKVKTKNILYNYNIFVQESCSINNFWVALCKFISTLNQDVLHFIIEFLTRIYSRHQAQHCFANCKFGTSYYLIFFFYRAFPCITRMTMAGLRQYSNLKFH